jgi:alcohol dehydrogenase
MAQTGAFATAGQIVFGNGCAESVGEHARRLGATRVMLVSDPGLERAGLVAQVRGWIAAVGLAVETYVGVQPEPSIDTVNTLLAQARAIAPDVFVGLGGGSSLDCTKAVAMLMTNGGVVEDYLGSDLVRQRGLPTVLMPTTAGTGSEVTPNAVFAVPAKHTKQVVVSRLLLPEVALVDPLLTYTAPPSVTAASGMDALCHAIEAYTSLTANPLADPYALAAMRLIATHLRTAVYDGQDAIVREGMALGSLYAGLALANAPMNAVHALAYPLQGRHHITHGLANALLLPHIVAYNASGSVERFARVAEAMGKPIGQLSPREAAAASAEACASLAQDVGIPSRLRDVGIAAEHLPALVEGALEVSRLLRNNPRPIGAQDIAAIFERAL